MADDPYKIKEPSPLKQLGFALFFGAIAATIAYGICTKLATPDQQVGSYQTSSAYKFVFYVTALAGGAVFMITMKVYKVWADKQYRKSLDPPQAKVVSKE